MLYLRSKMMLVLGTIGRWSCGKKNDVGAGDDWTLELWDKSDIGVLGKNGR